MDNFMYGDVMDITSDVTLTREEYNELVQDVAWLEALRQAGVDSWEGQSLAQEIFDTFNKG